jgi:hypothetical protein
MSGETILRILVWPAVCLVLGLVALCYLLPSIRGPLSRLKQLKLFGAEASLEQAISAQTNVEPVNAPGAAVPHPFELGDNPHALAVVEQIRSNVVGMTFRSADERDRWLFREGAKLSIALDFEHIYRNVWASQMELLGAANGLAGEHVAGLQHRYDAAAQNVPEVYGNYPIQAWRGFLEQNGLITQTADRVYATDKGRLFIQYLVARRYPLHGPYPNR